MKEGYYRVMVGQKSLSSGPGGFFIFLRSFFLFTTGNFTMDFASLQLVN